MGLTQAGVALIKKYHCPYCIALQTGALPLEQEALNKVRSSRQAASMTRWAGGLHASLLDPLWVAAWPPSRPCLVFDF
jgi:hypothetical protein